MHVQDDLEEIYWAFYSRRHGKDEEGRIAHDEKPDEEEKDVRGSVQIIEYSLRKQGYHVLLDEEKPGLWVFCRSEAEMEGIGQLQDPDEFACKYTHLYLTSLLISLFRFGFWTRSLIGILFCSRRFQKRNTHIEFSISSWQQYWRDEQSEIPCECEDRPTAAGHWSGSF